MSNPSPDMPDHQSPNPLSFKVPAGLLLILLGTLGFMAAFGQMLSYMFYINNWLSVVLSLLQLLVTAAVVGAGAMMLMRRAVAERLSLAAGLVGTVALLVLDLAGSLVMNGTASGALLPSLTAIPIVLLLAVGMFRSRHLPRLRARRDEEPAEAAAAVAPAPAKIAAAPAAVASQPKKATAAKAPATATKAKQPAPAAKAGPVTSANPINKAKAAGNSGKNTKAKAAPQAKAAAPKRPTQAKQPGAAGAGRQPGPARPVSKQPAKPTAGAQSKAASAPAKAKAKPAAKSTSGK
ncbi:hypothetical protein [Arthrobacter sp. HY1533]|uniref:hypothetical protein n=1 Tax=Arthrobacter sp. HY1533 TaxID=2970919 RepID=UPI0022B9F3CE|nr:hypothetical protein [Arthrobacter sp. HY1533]